MPPMSIDMALVMLELFVKVKVGDRALENVADSPERKISSDMLPNSFLEAIFDFVTYEIFQVFQVFAFVLIRN